MRPEINLCRGGKDQEGKIKKYGFYLNLYILLLGLDLENVKSLLNPRDYYILSAPKKDRTGFWLQLKLVT